MNFNILLDIINVTKNKKYALSDDNFTKFDSILLLKFS